MRLWSLHPGYLDPMGLVALWREGLLAKSVLSGKTTGYRNHPQLTRFLGHPEPVAAINSYLHVVLAESITRGYHFNAGKLSAPSPVQPITVTTGQLGYEFDHLLKKLAKRSPDLYTQLRSEQAVRPHPLLRPVKGPVEPWEKTG